MNKKSPLILKIVKGYLLLRIVVFILVIITFFFVKDLNPSHLNVLTGIRKGIMNSFNLIEENIDYQFGLLIGKLIFPIVLNLLAFYFLSIRKFWLALISVFLVLLTGFTLGIPFLTFIILIIISCNPSRDYLKRIEPKRKINLDLIDEDW